ncbi:hypothetical protein PFISCL1PPCAC_20253, partial [Pristionchus fissidentatus]
ENLISIDSTMPPKRRALTVSMRAGSVHKELAAKAARIEQLEDEAAKKDETIAELKGRALERELCAKVERISALEQELSMKERTIMMKDNELTMETNSFRGITAMKNQKIKNLERTVAAFQSINARPDSNVNESIEMRALFKEFSKIPADVRVYSGKKMAGGIEWYFYIMKVNTYLTVFLRSSSDALTHDSHSSLAMAKFRMISPCDGSGQHESCLGMNEYITNKPGHGKSQFMRIMAVMDPNNDYIKNDSIIVEVKVTLVASAN